MLKESFLPKSFFTVGVMFIGVLSYAAAPKAETLTDDDIRWRQNIGYNPQVHRTVPNSGDAGFGSQSQYRLNNAT